MTLGNTPWARAEEIFHDAVGLDLTARERMLRERCGADTSLREGVSFLLRGNELAAPEFIEPPRADANGTTVGAAPARIGRYRILRPLASGGMGDVYEAEQDVPRRTVALKVLRAGFASPTLVRRFEHESEMLGKLRHPAIAQVYDAGTYDSGFGPVPFFAMELVPGARPITVYAADQGLGVRERIGLFLIACDAVHHGHQRGIIHRDLKPGNILIDASGSPKVIDFGVARATDGPSSATFRTDAGQLIGTIGYMSPEQLTADPAELDTRTDVYSLGVVLYELLCGRLPHAVQDLPVLEAARLIRETPATRPSSVVPSLRGDVETIVLAAMEKDKARRYQSVAQLASDLRRYLADEPVSARPATTLYQLRKLARRHRGATAGAALALAGLLLGAAAATWQAVQATRQRDRAVAAEVQAKDEAQAAKRIARCLESALAAVDPTSADAISGPSDDYSTADRASPAAVLNATAETILRELKGRPLEQADLLDRLGRTYMRLGLWNRARAVVETSHRTRESVVGAAHPSLAPTLTLLGQVEFRDKRPQAAADAYRRVLRILPARDATEVARTAGGIQDAQYRYSVAQSLSNVLTAMGLLDEAAAVVRQAVVDGEIGLGALGGATARGALANVLCLQGDLHGARVECLSAIAAAKIVGDPLLAARLHAMLGTIEERSGDPAAAEALYQACQQAWFSGSLPDGMQSVSTAQQIANLFQSQWRYADSTLYLRDAHERARALLGPRHAKVAELSQLLAGSLQQEGRDADALPLYRDALQTYRFVAGEESEAVGSCLFRLAQIAAAQGDVPALEHLRADAAEHQRFARTLTESHPHRSGALLLGGLIETATGNPVAAEPLLRECVRLREQHLGANHKLTVYAQTVLGWCLTRGGKLDEAEALLHASVPLVEAGYNPKNFVSREARGRLDELRAARDRAR